MREPRDDDTWPPSAATPRSAVAAPLALALALLALALVGCGSRECVDEAHCVDIPGNFWFVLRGIGVFLAGLGSVVAVGVAILALKEDEGDTAAKSLAIAAALGAACYGVFPGTISPAEGARRDAHELRGKLEEERSRALAPERQRARARSAKERLGRHLNDVIRPLRSKYATEAARYVADLRPALKKSGVHSHEELLRGAPANQALINTVHRVAVLEHAGAWLDDKIREGEETVLALDQKAWELDHMIELHAVAPDGEPEAVARILASADAIVDAKTRPPEKQDVAATEAKVFDRVLEEAKR